GVQPPIAILLNDHAYETAHNILGPPSSMNSGLPDMPRHTPVSCSFGSSLLIRTMSCFGSMLWTTEMTSNENRSGLVPAKVVIPYPVIPRFTFSSGKTSGGAALANEP